MTLRSLPGILYWPGNMIEAGALAINPSGTLDAAGEYLAFVFVARENMTISHVGFRANAATGSPTAILSIETVDTATGIPNGLWAANTSGTTGTLTAGSISLTTLTAAASVTAGQCVAVKLQYNSGTSFQPSHILTWGSSNSSLPYYVTFLNSVTAINNIQGASLGIVLGSSTTSFYYIPRLFPLIGVTANSAFNQTTGQKKGAKFQVPFKCRCIGIRAMLSTTTTNVNIAMLDDAGSELSGSSTAYDGNLRDSLSGYGAADMYFDNAVTLSPGVWYKAVIEPTAGATNSIFNSGELASADYRGACPGGPNFYRTQLTSGAWTDTTTSIPYMDIIIDQFDDGMGAGAPSMAIGL